MKYKTFARFWDGTKSTRGGQCYGLLVIGMVLGLLGAVEAHDVSVYSRMVYGVIGGVVLGVLLILTMVVPSIYLAFIRKRKAEGEPVIHHRLLLALYFFPFLTFSVLGSAALVLTYLGK